MFYLFFESFMMKCILPARLWYTIITKTMVLILLNMFFLTIQLIVIRFHFFPSSLLFLFHSSSAFQTREVSVSTKKNCSLFTNQEKSSLCAFSPWLFGLPSQSENERKAWLMIHVTLFTHLKSSENFSLHLHSSSWFDLTFHRMTNSTHSSIDLGSVLRMTSPWGRLMTKAQFQIELKLGGQSTDCQQCLYCSFPTMIKWQSSGCFQFLITFSPLWTLLRFRDLNYS